MKIKDIIKNKVEIAEKRILELTKLGDLKKLSETEKHQIIVLGLIKLIQFSSFYIS